MTVEVQPVNQLDLTSQVQVDGAQQQGLVTLPAAVTTPLTAVTLTMTAGTDRPMTLELGHVLNHVMSDVIPDTTATVTTDTWTFTYPTPIDASHLVVNLTPISALAKVTVTVSAPDAAVDTTPIAVLTDTTSIANGRPVRSPFNPGQAARLTDGDDTTAWVSDQYPAYADIDLGVATALATIAVTLPVGTEIQFNLYGSRDGHQFDRLYRRERATTSTATVTCPVNGTYRHVQLLVLASDDSAGVQIQQVRVTGTAQPKAKVPTPPALALNTPTITAPTAAAVQQALAGIVTRRIGADYVDWFDFKVAPVATKQADAFQISTTADRVVIQAASGVTLATGLNYYLKTYCQVNLSQAGLGDHVEMPAKPVALAQPIVRQTTATWRYAYNYTTHAYTMAFWQAEDWQQELDWLALNGVNLVLDPTGLELVWYRFLASLGYQTEAIADFLTGPTYTAWQWMGNMRSFGGPIDAKWAVQRAKLAQHNQAFMHVMGMTPVLQAYAGLVPDDIETKIKACPVLLQGQWCGFQRPGILRTDSDLFAQVADQFYAAQASVYGEISHYYAVDPFHEGGDRADLALDVVAQQVLGGLLAHDAQGVWVLQSWQENPRADLLAGIRDQVADHVLVLDLYAERTPHWSISDPQQYGGLEFGGTPWLFCMLNNFGGRMGLTGHLDTLQSGYQAAQRQAQWCRGIGITPEASQSNPLLFDFFFDSIWADATAFAPMNIDEWLTAYGERRYGINHPEWQRALKIMTTTVYAAQYNQRGQGAPESLLNARPGLDLPAASTWGNAIVDYPTHQLVWALRLLRTHAADAPFATTGFQVDLVILAQQVLSNSVAALYPRLVTAVKQQDLAVVQTLKPLWFTALSLADQLADQVPLFRLSTWQHAAAQASQDLDDFSKDCFAIDALAIVTTWGGQRQADSGGLHDYSNRQWSGLTSGLYTQRWRHWFDQVTTALNTHTALPKTDWFSLEWQWVLDQSQCVAEAQPTALLPLVDQVLALSQQPLAQPALPTPTKPIKLMAVDMDGTFLDDHKAFNHTRFQHLLTQMRAHNQHFVVASGNQYQHLLDVFKDFEPIAYIAENGGLVKIGDEVIWQQTIPRDLAQAVTTALQQQPVFEDGLVVLSGAKDAYVDARVSPALLTEARKYYRHIQLVTDMTAVDDDFYKIALAWPGQPVVEQLTFLQREFPSLASVSSGFEGIDIIPKGISKAVGIKKLAERWGLSPAEMAVFGDNNNDIEMLQAVQYSFAMCNGNIDAQLAARYLTPADNNHEGVLDVMAHLI
ncbi:Cof-type HAD-IIB family hydrolase [Lactiplantibacillus fabifermentans]|uniref:HAD superfamily hydrolase n=1 Tax=Lactiplantibacillus fabifermentans DSM 21115 TaxID=1413187 RepID=A0A0R2NUX9_9LACO|nr:Cof-type HAD-IIB family hydrolase [Lactiplantibacillus fabifermentans]KRO29534.1 HAD superfamily hydrolase [Lactiplantibacillus fabifermentans DSM 21115]